MLRGNRGLRYQATYRRVSSPRRHPFEHDLQLLLGTLCPARGHRRSVIRCSIVGVRSTVGLSPLGSRPSAVRPSPPVVAISAPFPDHQPHRSTNLTGSASNDHKRERDRSHPSPDPTISLVYKKTGYTSGQLTTDPFSSALEIPWLDTVLICGKLASATRETATDQM